MNGCIYRTKDNECDLYSEGGKYSAFCVLIDGVKDCVGRKMSNADRIRSMTDEELAEWIVHKTEGNGFDGYEISVKAWLDWLRK